MFFSPELKLGVHFDTHNTIARTDNKLFAGEVTLLHFLEHQLGLYAPPRRDDHLRIEYYRLLLNDYVKSTADCFFAASFAVEPLACAEHLLTKRDELILAGVNFSEIAMDAPERLRAFAGIETKNISNALFSMRFQETPGFADRFMTALAGYKKSNFHFASIELVEPRTILPAQLQHFLKISEDKKIPIYTSPAIGLTDDSVKTTSALSIFKRFLLGEKIKYNAIEANDTSIVILETPNESDAATLLSHLQKRNPFKPFYLVKDSHRVLDEALFLNGLPTMGLAASSEVRPSLQILKLATAFLWKPIESGKILQFVSLQQKPLNSALGYVIARVLGEKPGMGSDLWKEQIAIFFNDYAVKSKEDAESEPIEVVRKTFNFWFNRARYDVNAEAPIDDVVEIFNFIAVWANQKIVQSRGKNTAMGVLNAQAQRIFEYLEALLETGERTISKQNMERVIRVIVEATPFQPTINTVHSTPYAYHESLIPRDVENLVWWNFTDSDSTGEPMFWEKSEINYLSAQHIALDTPQKNQARQLLYQTLPFLNTTAQIILVVPRLITGVEVKEHPLLSYLKVCFADVARLYVHYQNFSKLETAPTPAVQKLSPLADFNLPKREAFAPYIFSDTPTHLQLGFDVYGARMHENISTIDAVLYYPHQWFLGSVLNLQRTNLVDSVTENRLRGNTAHRFFELILNSDFYKWQKSDVDDWFDANALRILEHESVLLLQYGEETNLQYFLQKVKKSVWALINYIRSNGWRVIGTEKKLENTLNALKLKGVSDVVLQRANEICIVDLKWSGITEKQNRIKNREDFQLVLYGHCLNAPDIANIHGAYYIIDAAKLLVRNDEAFKDVPLIDGEARSFETMRTILNKIDATFQWRYAQFVRGEIEIRTKATANLLEVHYNALPENVLEMQRDSAKYDTFELLVKKIV